MFLFLLISDQASQTGLSLPQTARIASTTFVYILNFTRSIGQHEVNKRILSKQHYYRQITWLAAHVLLLV